jgi:hypothetical protein
LRNAFMVLTHKRTEGAKRQTDNSSLTKQKACELIQKCCNWVQCCNWLVWIAALLLLLLPGLDLPLRDWDEGIVAQVALERSEALRQFWQSPRELTALLLPTYWGEPYLNKPPGLHLLIAVVIHPWLRAGLLPPAWAVRLIPALLASAVVPLAAAITRRLRPQQPLAAFCSAAICLTLLPLMRHGRLAMLDGALVSASGLIWWQLLRAKKQPLAGGLGAGFGGSAILFLKAPTLLPVLGAGLILLSLDRVLTRRHWLLVVLGIAIGLTPGISWHLFHYWARGAQALWLWFGDGASRVLMQAGEGSDLGWRIPVLEVLEGGWPWLPLWPMAMVWAWQQRHTPEGRWPFGLQIAMAATVLPLRTQLPWYSHSLWLPFALVCGPLLVQVIESPKLEAVPGAVLLKKLPWFWVLIGALLLTAAPISNQWFILPAAMGLLLGGWGLRGQARLPALLVLISGWWLSLLLLLQGPLWHWELKEQAAVAPAAALVQKADPLEPIALWQLPERPSLSWQSKRRLLPQNAAEEPLQLLSHGVGPAPELAGHGCKLKRNGEDGWQLWRCQPLERSPQPHGGTGHLQRTQ